MFSIKAAVESVVAQVRRVILQATRSRVNPPGHNKHLKLSEVQPQTGVVRPRPKGVISNQHCTETQGASSGSLISSSRGIVNLLRPVTSRIVQGLARRVSSPLWIEARKKSAKRLFGETAPYFALVGVSLVSGPERGLLTAQDELEAICGDIREAISRAGWIHNPDFWKQPRPDSCSEGDTITSREFSLSDFELGSAINKGCNAVVYAARWKNEYCCELAIAAINEVQQKYKDGWLKDKRGLMPQILNDTWWNSQGACVATFIKKFNKYMEINTEQEIDGKLATALNNAGLYREALHLQKQLKEVAIALDKGIYYYIGVIKFLQLESDLATLSTAVEMWIQLLQSEDLKPYRAQIKKRMTDAVEPFFYVAYFMDPQYMDDGVEADVKSESSNSVASKIVDGPSKLSESVQDIFASGSLWSLEQIQSNSRAVPQNRNFSTCADTPSKTFPCNPEEKCFGGDIDDFPSADTSSTEDTLSFDSNTQSPNYNASIGAIANSAEKVFNLGENYSLASLNDTPSTSKWGLCLRSKNSMSLSDVNLLLSTGGFQKRNGESSRKRKKVKFKDTGVIYGSDTDEEYLHPTEGGSGMKQQQHTGISSSLEAYPLAMKMMFNYEAESNAPAILTAMYKEMLPAKAVQLDDVSSVWKQRLLNTSIILPSHSNIVDMPCVFVDRVPLLTDGFSLYPDALPRRLNPSGYGRNMSLFCVMRRYDCTLAEYLSQQKPNVRTSLLLLTQLLEAINHINKYSITHRDLKSDNLLLSLEEGMESPHLVLSDFGCCLPDPGFHVAFSSYEADPRVGNAALMAPEIKSATPGLLTWLNYSKADLWSVGTLAYEIFGLENPFAPRCYGNTPRSSDSSRKVVMLDSATYKECQLPRLPKVIPAEIRCLIQDLLKRNPKQRPSPTVTATICQLSLWGPRKWLTRHALTMPSNNEVMSWLLCLSTKVICEAGSASSSASRGGRPENVGAEKKAGDYVQEKTGGQLEYEIVSTFLKRVHYNDIIQAIKWIRAF